MNTPPPVEALLVIDIGNTRVGMAVWDPDGVHNVQHVSGNQFDSWRAPLANTWSVTAKYRRRSIVIGSVAPQVTQLLCPLIEEICDTEPLRIREDLPLPMRLDIEQPEEVGVDRVCCAAAAYERVGGPCAVASFGTATTIDCVSAEGHFLGGAIMPGLELSCEALHTGTAQLPRVKPAAPVNPFGRNTHDAIVNGVAYAAAGALREIVERFALNLGEWPPLVITGGNAPLISELTDFVDAVVPDLCLMGIALAYRTAAGQA
ncbi:MAG: type III pantothenate kinase [Planctomycetota bacterium]